MGYRSDVVLALNRDGVNELKKAIGDPCLNEETRKEVHTLFECPDKHLSDPASGSELWYWTAVKWYFDHPDVSFVEDFIGKISEANYRFLRIGEDWDDVEVDGYFLDDPFDLRLHQEIKFEGI